MSPLTTVQPVILTSLHILAECACKEIDIFWGPPLCILHALEAKFNLVWLVFSDYIT